MTQRGQLTLELNSSLSLITAAPQKAVDKAHIRAHRKVTTHSKCYKQNTFKKKIYIPFLPILLKNELVSWSPYSQSHFPSQKSEETDEQVPVRSHLTLLTLTPRLRLMPWRAGQHRAGRWGLSCCPATLTAAAPKQILGSFSPHLCRYKPGIYGPDGRSWSVCLEGAWPPLSRFSCCWRGQD